MHRPKSCQKPQKYKAIHGCQHLEYILWTLGQVS
jgi:hypothetical protein